MGDVRVQDLPEAASASPTDYFIVDNGSVTEKIKLQNFINYNFPPGFLQNGYISPTVAGNNLTLALKTLAGTDPSSTDPVKINIGNTVRTIVSALSVTLNAGTNWMNLGSNELKTKEVDLFAYIGYNGTDGITIGFSRRPDGRIYSDFSVTSTSENYLALSTRTNAAASDKYEVIGRFAATLSGGAGYTWSVPAYTNINLIQNPIYETRFLTYTPTVVGYTGTPTVTAVYKLRKDSLYLNIYITGTSNGTTLTATGPFTFVPPVTTTYPCYGIDNTGSQSISSATLTNASNVISFGLVAWTASGTKVIDFTAPALRY